ncbi:MAG TPA: type II secretion system F family protein [Vicinamibacterales bacterium]|nr:type II secretion system F family protein [Vicinamibacterales bacterium]
MTTYAWVGRTRNGQIVKGERAAETPEMLTEALKREQILVTSVGAAVRKEERYKRVSARSLAIFTRQFSVMIDAGLPLVQCLELLAKEEPDKRLAAAIDQVRVDVEAGSTLADAMQKRPYAFDFLFTNMIAAGEAGGILDVILQRLSTFIEKQAKLVSQVKSAMIYPIAVLSIAAIVVTVIMIKVVPTFEDLFRGLNAKLPATTLMVIWISNKMVIGLPFFIVGGMGMAFVFRRYYASKAGRLKVDAYLLKLPMLGVIFKKVAVARFCRTLSTLIGSGVPILDGLDITAKTSGNAIIENAIRTVRSRIERGETIAAPLRASGIFPPMVVQMIGAGESTGALDAMLAKIADFYEDEVDVAVKGLLTVLEPMLIAVLGVIVGTIVVAMYLPLFDLINQLS